MSGMEVDTEQATKQLQRNSHSVFGGFELSLRHPRHPLRIETFNWWGRPVPCLPMIWVYGCKEPMPMAIPFVMVELPVIEEPKGFEGCKNDNIDIWMLVHASPQRAPCQKTSHELAGEVKLDEVNLSHHAWLLRGLDAALSADPNLSVVTEVQTGIFDAIGACPTHQDLRQVESRGLAFERLEPREVIVHGGGSFSPCNNMLQLESSHIFHCFISKSIGKVRRVEHSREGAVHGAIILHIVPAHEEAEQRLRKLTGLATTLPDICAALHVLDPGAYNAFDAMLECCVPDLLTHVRIAAKQRAEEYIGILAADPSLEVLKPWRAPHEGFDDRVTDANGMDIVALALQMVDQGCPDFDMNMEILTSVGGNLELALQILSPCSLEGPR